jgi:hypothetical protein
MRKTSGLVAVIGTWNRRIECKDFAPAQVTHAAINTGAVGQIKRYAESFSTTS